MRITVCQDVTFVIGWQRPYECISEDPLTKVKPIPASPTTEFYAKQFPALDALIKTPVAFAMLAPLGWDGERCWYEYDKLSAYGWLPVAWKESTHCDKSFVQLYMKELPRADLLGRPKSGALVHVSYDGKKGAKQGDLPYLGCSSILTAMDAPLSPLALGDPQMYQPRHPVGFVNQGRKITRAKVSTDECIHFVRLARPSFAETRNALKTKGFRELVSLKWNSYWVRGKPGIGSEAECEY